MEYSLEALDLALDYLNNNKKITEIDTLGAMIQSESKQFINITESIDIVLNEKFDPKQIKETIKNAIRKILDKIKDFIEWVKMKVLKLFSAIYLKLKNRKSLKQLYNEVKTKATHESVEFVNEDGTSNKAKLDEFLDDETGLTEYFTPIRIKEMYNEFSEILYSDCFERKNADRLLNLDFYDYVVYACNDDLERALDSNKGGREVTIRYFITKDWQKQAEELTKIMSKDMEDNLKWTKSKQNELEKTLSDIDRISDDEIKNANSLADLVSLSSSKNEDKENIQITLRKIAKALEFQMQFINFAKKYLQRCNNIVDSTESFFTNLKKSVS